MLFSRSDVGSLFARSAICVAVAMVTAPAMAQNTTSAVAGRITAPDGKPVAGVAVTIVHTESGSTNRVTTDAEGRYSARGLRVGGPYVITFTKDGATQRRDGIYLDLAEALALDATLGGTATSLGAVAVTGSVTNDKFSSNTMGAGTKISNRELNAFASIQRNLQDYARLDPRVSQTDKERGEISVAGQNSRYNSVTIDGVRTNDTFGLESNNLPTAKQPISIDAIESVQVNVSNFDVTQQGYTGANINAVTKSGTNDFKGSVYYVWRNDATAGDRFNRTDGSYNPPAKFKETTTGVTLGGPIIKDKLFFFTSLEELRSTRAAPDFGPLGSSVTNVGITPAQIAAAQAAAKSVYGIDIGGTEVPAGTELLVKDFMFKLDWNISDQHRASVRYSKTEQKEPFFSNFGTRSLALNSNFYNQSKNLETLVGQWFADWTPDFSTEFKLSQRNYDSQPISPSALPQVSLNFTGALPAGTPASVATGTRTLTFGTERSRHFNVLQTKTLDGYFAGNLVKGDHEIKAGGDYSRNKVFNAFLQDTNGNYNFTGADPVALFAAGLPSSYQVQLPVAGSTINDGAATWSSTNIGLFAQDNWNVNKNLTVSYGVRVDTINLPEKPKFNAAASAPMVAGNPTTNTRQSGGFGLDNSYTIDGENLIQPRVGFNYAFDAANKRKAQIRGGFGLFQGAAANVWLSNPYSNTGVSTRIIGCGGSFAACPTTGRLFSGNPATQPSSLPGNTPAANVDFLAPGLNQPSVWKLNLAADAELPWYGLVAGAEWLHTRTDKGIYYRHLNLGTATRKGSDGRDLFYTAQGYNNACWSATGVATTGGATCTGLRSKALSNPAFNNVLVAEGTDQGVGNSLTLSLSKQISRDFGWSLAYTRATATEVSPLTSSVANSNFNARSIFNPNEQVAANSAYLTRDRVNASVNWSKAFIGNYKTTVGLFYEGRKGKPYSWTFNNDLNGDGVGGNDLMYIPSAPGSGEVVFRGDTATNKTNEDKFWAIVNGNSELSAAKGSVVKRNGSFAPFVNNFDLRLSQEVRGLTAKHKGVFTFDILNVGNLLNKKWGRIDEIAFQGGGGSARSFVNYNGLDANGKYIYSVVDVEDNVTRQAKGESQWALQVTLRYEF